MRSILAITAARFAASLPSATHGGLLFCLLTACIQPARAADQSDAFTAAIEEAKSYTHDRRSNEDRAKAVECYRRALTLRPECPENMSIHMLIGSLLLDMEGEPERQNEGRAVLESILTRYNHMDYYEVFPNYVSDSPQYQMITVAIYAAHGDPATARTYYMKGMSFLNQTYRRRLEDWRNEPAPQEPVEPFDGPMEVEKWKGRLHDWESRQNAVESGDIFPSDAYEVTFVKSLVRLYGQTYGNIPYDEVEGKLQPIIHAFPGSPLEKEARRLIANVSKIGVVELPKAVAGIDDIWVKLSSLESDR